MICVECKKLLTPQDEARSRATQSPLQCQSCFSNRNDLKGLDYARSASEAECYDDPLEPDPDQQV